VTAHRVFRLQLLRSRFVAFAHDLLVIPIAWFGAYLLRFNLETVPEPYLKPALLLIPAAMLVQGVVSWHFGLYRGLWRFASMPDLIRIIKSVIVGTTILAATVFLLTRMQDIPRSVFPLYAILLVGLLAGPRAIYRWFKDHHLYLPQGKRVLIVGAGQAGEMLVRDLLRAAVRAHEPVGFLDDNPAKLGKEIHGVRVLGDISSLPEAVADTDVTLVLIAVPSATSSQMQRIVSACEQARIPFRTLPRMQDLVSGQVGIQVVRDVRIDDLLGREKVTLDWSGIAAGLAGRSVLVTGGGGSIGSELCRQLARLKPSKLIVFERSEFNLYKTDHDLRRLFPDLMLESVLGDVTDTASVDATLRAHRPNVVFHAAAYKHVPLLEHQVRSAVFNNVLGTCIVADKAIDNGCEEFVLISTDKAVNPANVMGTTKRIAEIYCQGLNKRSATRFITVRFGNVLGSDGSVIPLFQQQIAAGGPVTVTHPDITRYFMTIPEACQLILQACVIGKGGEIFVLDMGEPVKISYLAEQLILLSGKRPGEDVEIVYTGLRPGEKLYEELFHPAERLRSTGHPKIMLAASRQIDPAFLQATLRDLETACRENDETRLQACLASLVPEQVASHGTESRAVQV
jgi:FlaA1/EpsC-like NDP-sugar epimerase